MRRAAPRATLALLAGLAACQAPPPEAYTNAPSRPVPTEPAGLDARGEACLARPGAPPVADLPVSRVREIYCGGYTQPAARVTQLRGAGDPAELDRLATGGIWRTALERRLACNAPTATTLA